MPFGHSVPFFGTECQSAVAWLEEISTGHWADLLSLKGSRFLQPSQQQDCERRVETGREARRMAWQVFTMIQKIRRVES